ncbi:MAG: sensor histidine kinase [Spirochaetes bacterium]|nr:sensor histidine kinase [Spirochaetota bacterium]
MQYSVCDYLIDLLQNSVEAKATVITLDYIEKDGSLSVCIGDNGSGMNEETLKKSTDPFYTDGIKHKNRKVGLGLPFLIQMLENIGGEFDIKSEEEMGTSLFFSISLDNIDCPPEGDIAGTFRTLMTFDGEYDLLINRHKNGKNYSISRSELAEALGDLNSADSQILAKQFFVSQEDDLK